MALATLAPAPHDGDMHDLLGWDVVGVGEPERRDGRPTTVVPWEVCHDCWQSIGLLRATHFVREDARGASRDREVVEAGHQRH